MSLFHINRYLGDEDDRSSSKSRSKALLAKLQSQARARQEQQNTTSVNNCSSRQPVHPSTEKAQVESDAEDQFLQVEQTAQNEDGKSDTIKTCKREKRKETSEEYSEEVCSGTRRKKRKQQLKVHADETVEGSVEEKVDSKSKQLADQSGQDSLSGFTILGGFESKPIQKVQMVLPQWLAQPDIVQKDIKQNLVPICEVRGLCPRMLEKLESNGIQHFFPVQAEVIPAILEGVTQGLLVGRGGFRPCDICVSAPTGSGKTLAFVIPVVQALLPRVLCEVRVLVVLPTKELAQQVYKVFHSYTEGTDLKVVMIAGQKSLAAEQSSLLGSCGDRLCSLADIVVATPGRLVDHINMTTGFSLQQLRFLIIDEADRMIDSMHQSWLDLVNRAVYAAGTSSDVNSVFRRTEARVVTAASLFQPQIPLQKLLFSATLTYNPEKLQQLGLYQPRLFSSTHNDATRISPVPQERFNFPQGLTEYYVPCTLGKKPLLILHFILRLKFRPVLCFTNSREAAHRLYLLVKLFGGVQVAEFSSRLSPTDRKQTLKEFEQGKIQLLISTDATARGIDISGVKCVVNYDAPQFIRTYIHRVGRTARAGKAGLAFTFLLKIQENDFLQMLKDAGSPGVQKQIIKPESLKAMESHYENTLLELENAIKEEKAKKLI